MASLQENQISNIFRLSTVLFAEDNYTISSDQLHKKVIENALFEMQLDRCVDVQTVADFIEMSYNITFTEDEIWNVVTTKKLQDKVFVTYTEDHTHFVSLSALRKATMANKTSAPNIGQYIDEYIDTNSYPKGTTKSIIYRFLYSVFTMNTENFKRLVNNPSIDGLSSSAIFDNEERDIINGFLNWQNSDKDKAIFNVASCALEYCLLTNTNNTSITLESLRNKRFYLDTNIVYRALGINGELRKKRTISILKKFQSVGETLHISQVTNNEFKNSVKYHCEVIKRYGNPNVNPKLFEEISEYHKDFYTSYQEWRVSKINNSVDLYEADLLVRFDNFIKAYNIEVETFAPYDKSDDEVRNIISDYTKGILSYKHHKYENKAKHDAKNILWIECKREKQPTSIFEANCFMLSSDHRLQCWDYSRSSNVPAVFLPSQWLSITLRFLARTNDDFSSFVSFLNLPHNERLMDNDQLLVVLSGISEYASNYESQSRIYQKFVEGKVSKAMEDTKAETLYEEAKAFAKSELEKELEKTKKQLEEVTNDSTEAIEAQRTEISQKDIISNNLNETIVKMAKHQEDIEGENTKLKEQNMQLKTKIAHLKQWGVFICWMVLSILLIGVVVLAFFFQSWEYNFVAYIIDFVDSLSESRRYIGQSVFGLIAGGCIWKTIKKTWKEGKKLFISNCTTN